MMPEFNIPGMEGFLAAQRRNFEAFTAANQLAMEGVQAVVRRQAEIARQNIEEASKAFSELMTAGPAEDKVSRQAELVKSAFDKSMNQAKEMVDLLTKSNAEAADVLTKRVRDGLEELKSTFANGAAKPATAAGRK